MTPHELAALLRQMHAEGRTLTEFAVAAGYPKTGLAGAWVVLRGVMAQEEIEAIRADMKRWNDWRVTKARKAALTAGTTAPSQSDAPVVRNPDAAFARAMEACGERFTDAPVGKRFVIAPISHPGDRYQPISTMGMLI